MRGKAMTYESENEAKANFDNVYVAATPHAYIAEMAKNGYEIGEQARPYCAAAVELLQEHTGSAWPVHMLDVGCSYGIGSAFVKHGCSFDEMVAFFSSRAPQDYRGACEAVRMWLNVTSPTCDIRTVGLDSSEPAIRFALDAGMLNGGIARDFEQDGAAPTEDEIAWFRSCNLMISTGAIGYVTERTLDIVLEHLGKDHPREYGPYAVVTMLRMFDGTPIKEVFERHGLTFGSVPSVRLPQRRFADAEERKRVIDLLNRHGVDTREWEARGRHYANLYVAAPSEQFDLLRNRMAEVRTELDGEPEAVGYIQR